MKNKGRVINSHCLWVALFLIAATPLWTMDAIIATVRSRQRVRTEIAQQCVHLVQRISKEQPRCFHTTQISILIVSPEEFDEGSLCALVDKSAYSLKRRNWGMSSFSSPDRQGLTLQGPQDGFQYHPEELKDEYKNVIEMVQSGWKFAGIKHYPHIQAKLPAPGWLLFIKKAVFFREELLINSILTKYALTEGVVCGPMGHQEEGIGLQQSYIYLGVKKEVFDSCNALLKLE